LRNGDAAIAPALAQLRLSDAGSAIGYGAAAALVLAGFRRLASTVGRARPWSSGAPCALSALPGEGGAIGEALVVAEKREL